MGATQDPLAEVAFKPYTHVEIARDARADVIDDGQLTIGGQTLDVHPKIVAALQNYEAFYYAGTVGPDGFPDVVMGQGVIHSGDTGTWLTRILDMAWAAQDDPSFSPEEQSQILAWSYGFLTHAAGDHWAHTLVNEFAEGVFPEVGDVIGSIGDDERELANALRHFLVEGYVGDATPGFDSNRDDRTLLPDGDVSDDSTPGIPFDAPARFIYEALIRPFPNDPTPIAKVDLGDTGVLTANTGTNAFDRSTGSFEDDGFKVGQKIVTAGFETAANNGEFHVTAVTPTSLTVSETLTTGDETATAANGDETIRVFVPSNAPTTINVDAATDSFIRASGSFLDDGFVVDQRFAAYGFESNQDDYLVESISLDGLTLTVYQDLTASESGSGDEQLVAQGDRGKALNAIFAMRDEIEMLAMSRDAFSSTSDRSPATCSTTSPAASPRCRTLQTC